MFIYLVILNHVINHKVTTKPGRPKTTWSRELQSELKDEKISSFSDAFTHAKSKERVRTIERGLCFGKKI